MTNKTITLPRNLVEEVVQTCAFTLTEIAYQELRAALADPVPPAGGEPEVFRIRIQTLYSPPEPEARARLRSEWVDAVKLTDHRAHVTRLQTEVGNLRDQRDALKAEVERLGSIGRGQRKTIDNVQLQVERLQAELTKARELMMPAAHRLSDLGQSRLSEPMFAFVLNQSAPADKGQGEPVASPGYPPVPEDRKIPADAGGYGVDAPCPECGSRDCNGQCFGDDMMGDS